MRKDKRGPGCKERRLWLGGAGYLRDTTQTEVTTCGPGGGPTHAPSAPSAQPEGDQELGLWSWERQKPAQGSETSESVSRGNPTARQPSWVECDQPPAREPQPPAGFAPVRQSLCPQSTPPSSGSSPLQVGKDPAPGPHGAQRLRPGRAPGAAVSHLSTRPDRRPATPLAAEAPRDPRSAARRGIRSAGTQRPGPRRGRVLQAPKTSAWEKGRLSSTRFPSPRPRSSAPQRQWKDIRQPPHPICGPSPAPSPHSLAQVGVLISGGLLVEETEGQRGEAPCPGPRSPGIKELKSRL